MKLNQLKLQINLTASQLQAHESNALYYKHVLIKEIKNNQLFLMALCLPAAWIGWKIARTQYSRRWLKQGTQLLISYFLQTRLNPIRLKLLKF